MEGTAKLIKRRLVPEYIQALKPYQSGKPIDELARELGLKKISKLASNENPLGPSPFAIKEMTTGLWDLYRYPDMHAYRCKKALADLYGLKLGNIILGNGSEGIMSLITKAFLRPNDEILTSKNTFIGFYVLAQSIGAKLNLVDLTEDYRFNVKALANSINDQTRIVYIANPNNPTGTYIKKEEFDYLMGHVPEHTLVILDEAYFEFAQDCPDYPDSMHYRYDNVLTLRTFSKAYGLAGIRVGYGFGHEELIESLAKIKLPFEPNLIAQLGARGAIEDAPHLKRTLECNAQEMDRLVKFLKKEQLAFIPSVTNFVMIKTESEKACDFLFNSYMNKGVILRPAKANGMPEFLRISIGRPDEMDHFFEASDYILPEYRKMFLKG